MILYGIMRRRIVVILWLLLRMVEAGKYISCFPQPAHQTLHGLQ